MLLDDFSFKKHEDIYLHYILRRTVFQLQLEYHLLGEGKKMERGQLWPDQMTSDLLGKRWGGM